MQEISLVRFLAYQQKHLTKRRTSMNVMHRNLDFRYAHFHTGFNESKGAAAPVDASNQRNDAAAPLTILFVSQFIRCRGMTRFPETLCDRTPCFGVFRTLAAEMFTALRRLEVCGLRTGTLDEFLQDLRDRADSSYQQARQHPVGSCRRHQRRPSGA